MRWALPLLLVVAGFGLALSGAPAASPMARGPVSGVSLALAQSGPLAPAAPLPAMAGAPACRAPDTAGWAGARRWIGTLQGWPESPVVQAWRRFVLLTRDGVAPATAPETPCAG
jgi:hypothetical protein